MEKFLRAVLPNLEHPTGDLGILANIEPGGERSLWFAGPKSSQCCRHQWPKNYSLRCVPECGGKKSPGILNITKISFNVAEPVHLPSNTYHF